MKYLGTIITKSKVDEGGLFNVVSDFNGIIRGIPTLIIGWETAKSLFPDASIINSEIIEDNVYWTFGRTVRRDVYEKDLSDFKDRCANLLRKKIDYSFYSVLSDNRGKVDSFIDWVSSNPGAKTAYILNDMVYIYVDGCNKVIGVSVRDVDYSGYNNTEFFRKIYGIDKKNVVRNDEVSLNFKTDFRNSIYLVPYVYSPDFSEK